VSDKKCPECFDLPCPACEDSLRVEVALLREALRLAVHAHDTAKAWDGFPDGYGDAWDIQGTERAPIALARAVLAEAQP